MISRETLRAAADMLLNLSLGSDEGRRMADELLRPIQVVVQRQSRRSLSVSVITNIGAWRAVYPLTDDTFFQNPITYNFPAESREDSAVIDYRAELDKATREWARALQSHNASAGPFERDFATVVNVVNVFRHAAGLAMFRTERELDER